MRARAGILIGLLVLAVPLGARADDPRPVAIAKFVLDTDVAEDGTIAQTIHIETAVGNDAAATRAAQQPLSFSDAVEQLQLVEAYTQKPNGSRIAVDPANVRVQLAPGIPNLPAYTDRKQMVAVFPDVQGGDRLVLTWRRSVTHPVFAGQFAATSFFTRAIPWDDVDITTRTPADKKLQVETHGLAFDEATEPDGRHRYHWHYSQPVTLAEDPAVVAPLDRVPRLFASTFADWRSVSHDYAGLFAPQTEVTPRIQALADEITAGTTDEREQAKLLYQWVTRHVRWVAIYLGNENWVPHRADSVLANGYGDCKDQVALFVALLKARGIAAEPVLINLSPRYTISGPAVLAFDHCITYLPAWSIYADTTSGGAAFGSLPFAEYGKPVLHVRAEGAAPEAIGPLPPDVAVQSFRTEAVLGTDGIVTGTSVTEAAGPYATALRSVGRAGEAEGAARLAARQLRSLGEPGQGDLIVPPTSNPEPSYRIEGSFRLDAHPDWLEGDGFTLPTGLRLLARAGDLLIGPIAVRNLPRTEPAPCYAGPSEEMLSLTLPPGYRPMRLPPEAVVEGSFFRYESHFAFDAGVLTARRSLASRFDGALCRGEQRAEAAKALAEIRRDLAARFRLEKTAL